MLNIGQAAEYPPDRTITIITEDEYMAENKKAPHDGTYKLGSDTFRIRKGDVLPEGAEMVSDTTTDTATTEQRAQQTAPQNKAQRTAPESK